MYRPADEVHWIQARKAWEDRECWVKVRIVEVQDTRFQVRLSSGEAVWLYCGVAARARNVFRGRPLLAVLCERWGVLGIPRHAEEEGGPVALSISDPPARVFRLAGSREVRFFNVRRILPTATEEAGTDRSAPPRAVLVDGALRVPGATEPRRHAPPRSRAKGA